MVSKQYTILSILMPVAMTIGTLVSIYAFKQSQMGLTAVIAVGSMLLIILLFHTYRKTKKLN